MGYTSLLPCPFCGSEAEIGTGLLYMVCCTNHKCIAYHIDTAYSKKKDAVINWNRRIKPAKLPISCKRGHEFQWSNISKVGVCLKCGARSK